MAVKKSFSIGLIGGGAALFSLLLSTCSSQLTSDRRNQFSSPEAMFVTNVVGDSVNVYLLGNDGDVLPTARIKGAATGLDVPTSIALDSSGEIYVLNNGSVRNSETVEVFAPGSRGNVAPIARIAGADTGLRSVNKIAVDSARNIYVAIEVVDIFSVPAGILIYPSGSNGNVRPRVTIGGADSEIQNPYGIAVGSNGNLFVAESFTHDMGRVLVFPAGSKGNAKPSVAIEGPDTGLYAPTAVALDSNGNLYVANNEGRNRRNLGSGGSITVFKLDRDGRPTSAAGLDGPTPAARIIGPKTGLMNDSYASIPGIAIDSSKNIYITLQGGRHNEINKVILFAAGSDGDVAPRAVISGHNTMLSGPSGIAIGPYPGIH